jgi:hypothetical protein
MTNRKHPSPIPLSQRSFPAPRPPVKLTGVCIKETDKAMFLNCENIHGESCQVWLPLSRISKIVRQPNSKDVEITIEEWLAYKNYLCDRDPYQD